MRSLPVALFFLVCAPLLMAAPPSPLVRVEIEALLDSLQSSGCEFSRNGSWHTAAQARAHLLLKLNNFSGSEWIERTEEFITVLGSSSSTTGRPYMVKCGDTPPVTSKSWLTAKLKTIRSADRPYTTDKQ